jgi:hypothetical protein
MKKYKEYLDNFTKIIVGNSPKLATGIISDRPNTTKEKALNVYIDGYKIRLNNTLSSSYPALKDYLGDEKFGKVSAKFIQEVKSTSYNLDHYPLKFAEFFRVYNMKDAFANELCHLECEIQKVFFMPDSEPLTMREIAVIEPEALGDIILKLRMASIGLSFKYNTNEYFTAFREGNAVAPMKKQEYIFIYRHDNLVQRKILSEAEFLLVSDVKNGMHLNITFEKMSEKFSQEEILGAFQSCINQGLFRK